MKRISLIKKLQGSGLNVGKVQDAIYKDLVKTLPFVGDTAVGKFSDKYNRWLFDKFTRGLMSRTALHEFERISQLDPSVDSKSVADTVARDINNMYGNIGRQGWIKSKKWQDVSRMLVFAPQWAEGLIKKDMAIPYKLMTGVKNGEALKLLKGQETIGRAIIRGTMFMAALTQVANIMSKGKPTWENEDDHHKWDADLGDGVFLSPLSLYNEIIHDFVRYFDTKPKAWDAIQTIGENKLGFYSRAALVLLTDKSPTGEYQTTTAGVLSTAAKQIIPTPLTFRGPVGLMTKGLTPDVEKNLMSIAGLKPEIGRTLLKQVSDHANEFVTKNKLRSQSTEFMVTDEPSYGKLRKQLFDGDINGASGILEELRKTKSDSDIMKAMAMWERRPFTGSNKSEGMWLRSMTDSEREQYHQALIAKRQNFNKWIEFYLAHR